MFIVPAIMTPHILASLLVALFCMEISAQSSSKHPTSTRAQAAAKNVRPKLENALASKGLRFGDPVFMRILKEEAQFELWMWHRPSKTFHLFKTYEIAAFSGSLGPKLKEGDRQAPEGFYYVPASQLNPNSRFHLAFNLG